MAKVPMRMSGWWAMVATVWSLVTATNASAELTEKQGSGYATLCKSRGVPLPPPFGGSPNKWTKSGQLAGDPIANEDIPNQSFNDGHPVDIYYYQQTSSPQGLCMAAAKPDSSHNSIGTIFFGIICQGTNGKVCFWDQAADFSWNPTTNSLNVPTSAVTVTSTVTTDIPVSPALSWMGGSDLAGGENETCSNCHSGANAFINHPGTATDLLGRGLVPPTGNYWFPSQWPEPIVPLYDAAILGPWPQNPGPGKYTAAMFQNNSACLGCHVQNGPGGAFPTMSTRLDRYCSRAIDGATTRLNRACPGTYNPFVPGSIITCPTGAMPPDVHQTFTDSSGDIFPSTMLSVDCLNPPLARNAVCGSNAECGSLVCTSGHCAVPACSPKCIENSACGANSDCLSGSCSNNVCDRCTTCPDPAVSINCGNNGAFPPFVADKFSSGGATKTRSVIISLAGVDNPAPADVYKSQRYASPFSYTIPGFGAGSQHKIYLHFAETNPANNAPNRRKFSVAINGTTQITNLDLFAKVGMNHAYVVPFQLAANAAGQYIISFTASLDSATISGIEVQ
jgi:hypothetical protein